MNIYIINAIRTKKVLQLYFPTFFLYRRNLGKTFASSSKDIQNSINSDIILKISKFDSNSSRLYFSFDCGIFQKVQKNIGNLRLNYIII